LAGEFLVMTFYIGSLNYYISIGELIGNNAFRFVILEW